jgi:hypothetical protein
MNNLYTHQQNAAAVSQEWDQAWIELENTLRNAGLLEEGPGVDFSTEG